MRFREVHYWVKKYTGQKICDRTLRYWFRWCEIKSPRGRYEWSDLAKLVYFGWNLDKTGTYEEAQAKLIQQVQEDFLFFFPDDEVENVDFIEVVAS
jgi:hypothetical protein